MKDDQETKATLTNVISIAQRAGKFDESVLFRGENANVGRTAKLSDYNLCHHLGSQRRVQNPLPKRNPNNGLHRVRQVSIVG